VKKTHASIVAAWVQQTPATTDRYVAAPGQDPLLEDVPHGRWRDPIAEPDQFTRDPAMTPARFLQREPDHQLPDDSRCPWTSSNRLRLRRVRPVPCDLLPVPAQQCLRRHDPHPQQIPRHIRASAARTNRSFGSSRGRATCRRNTATSCRRTSSSTSLYDSPRPRITTRATTIRKAEYRALNNT
jgi:hypothetical protein